ncbi:hypothetical protein QBC36DRAFT_292602 [Triangularia setosa]|uniref:Uncharacterized protein n=1 Tax=Triangularia setosa TaxID=2587417 RepID=A0AAN7A5P7_9PEZI|nr:hypothetical protein QBC36DRAFT_292602 [Podospora setosa]
MLEGRELQSRQDNNRDDEDDETRRRRFRFGNNRNNNDRNSGDGEGDNNRNNRFNGGGRGGNDDDDDDNNGGGGNNRGGNRDGGGNNRNGKFGGNRGNGRGGNNNNNNGNDNDDNDGGNGGNRNGGNGNRRFRGGFRNGNGNGNNRNDDSSPPENPPEADPSVSPPPSEDSPPAESAPAEPVLGEPVPEGLVPEGLVPEGLVPEGPVPAELVPAEPTPAEPAPVEPSPSEAIPAEAVPPESTSAPSPPPASEDPGAPPNPGVIVLQSQIQATPTVEGVPTVTDFVPVVTVSNLDGASGLLTEIGGSGPQSDGAVPFPTDPAATSLPVPDIVNLPGGDRDGNGSGPTTTGTPDDSNRIEAPQGGMDPTAERVLISVGSIGAFILICFIVWMVRRTMKKSRLPSSVAGTSSGGGLPFFGRKNSHKSAPSTVTLSPPPKYREKEEVPEARQVEEYYPPEKTEGEPQLQSQPPPAPPQQQVVQPQVLQATLPLQQQQQPQLPPLQTSFPTQQPQVPFTSYYQPSYNADMTYDPTNAFNIMPPSLRYSHQQQESFSSTNAAQFGAFMVRTEHANGTYANGVSPITTYYTPSPIAQQPPQSQQLPVPYNLVYQEAGRRSLVSSLSSGFGDGADIVTSATLLTPPQPAATAPRSSSHYSTRFSYVSPVQQQPPPLPQQPQGQRDTVYTQASEDQPSRHRSLNSWVEQQTGRIVRTQERDPAYQMQQEQMMPGHPGIPGIHNPPDEQNFRMMMQDDEVPRRVESALANMSPTERSRLVAP